MKLPGGPGILGPGRSPGWVMRVMAVVTLSILPESRVQRKPGSENTSLKPRFWPREPLMCGPVVKLLPVESDSFDLNPSVGAYPPWAIGCAPPSLCALGTASLKRVFNCNYLLGLP